ncbi:MAG: 16S rRNA (guanine(966)-N(2))-methyltransferase RsmD [Deltaproteobacteria bacterium]|nr:16S rRNA (guanine(966)-N(2))-methyltransferase RsmD [Deltaproteobacteria bacterium]MBW1977479.1 16S rRNA (guanine(966)-N(2))-methyltransferase RsmD [Deltaproteobacteria bacterium]MBW2044678.1 16S rRNA (guanine(966)-N(2))-methyltransferase RsmD [Deltaproteobacteria bacterium]MBW2299690.1 16S rRNA (guanine(966)-N(2))-methyltransferase RsmD [Deltaproteobacteria bacterium]
MRVTGGILKGRRLATPRGLEIRPTSDMVREAIFNLIGHDLSGALVLDLFAGTGSLGIEALSRGAARSVFIDRSVKALGLIRKNLEACGIYQDARLVRKDLTKGLPKGYLQSKEKANLVLIDPPYGKGLIVPLLRELSVGETLSADCIIVAESAKEEILPEAVERLRLVKARVYGGTKINLFLREEDK